MRFCAAAVVFLHHIEGFFNIPDLAFPLRRVAVSFFFVLSGFVLTLIYAREDRPFKAKQFFGRRFLRLYPLHWAILALALLLVFGSQRNELSDPTEWSVALGKQVLLVQTWIPGDAARIAFNGVTWSMSNLVFFYLCFPGIVKCRRHLFLLVVAFLLLNATALMVMASLANADLIGRDSVYEVIHFFPPFRLIEFLLGAFAATVFRRIDAEGGWVKRIAQRPVIASVVDLVLVVGITCGWQYGSTHLSMDVTRLLLGKRPVTSERLLEQPAPNDVLGLRSNSESRNDSTQFGLADDDDGVFSETMLASFKLTASDSNERTDRREPRSSLLHNVHSLPVQPRHAPVPNAQVHNTSESSSPKSKKAPPRSAKLDGEVPHVVRPGSTTARSQMAPSRTRNKRQNLRWHIVNFGIRWWGYVGFAFPSIVLIIWFCFSRGIVGWLLARRVMVYLGELSFAIFLVHRPVILWVRSNLTSLTLNEPVFGAAVCIVITLFVSVLLYQFVESPISRTASISAASWWSRYRQAVSNGLQSSRIAFMTSGCLIAILVVAYLGQDRAIREINRTKDREVRFDSGLAFDLTKQAVGKGFVVVARRKDDTEVSGRLVLQFINENGEVIRRLRIGDLNEGEEDHDFRRIKSPIIRPNAYESLAYIRCVHIPNGLKPARVMKGSPDLSRRGQIIWQRIHAAEDPDRPSMPQTASTTNN